MTNRPRNQKAIVERGDSGLLIMFDCGSISYASNVKDAERQIMARAKKNNRGVTITTIEWRDGLKPDRC